MFTVCLAFCCQVYTGSWGDHDGIIRCKLGEVVHYELGEEPEPRREAPAFDKPTRGTSVEKFREMVFNHLKVKNRVREVHMEPTIVVCGKLDQSLEQPPSSLCPSRSISPSLESRLIWPASSARSSLSPMATKMDGCHCQKPVPHGPYCRWMR